MSEEILIVDDNADIRNIINELIIDAGYKTRLAANYNQALSEIDKKLPDVAILDVKLDKGDNDGIELLSHIKSKNKDTPVIIISVDDSGIGKASARSIVGFDIGSAIISAVQEKILIKGGGQLWNFLLLAKEKII